MTRPIHVDFDFRGAARILNLPAPASATEPATKDYVDSAVEGQKFKLSCRVAAQVSLSISSPGATIDGITMASMDRVLLAFQASAAENGIYVWTGATSPMTRALDANTFAELEQAVTTVEEGSSAGASYRQTAINGTLGSSSVQWTAYGTAAPQASTVQSGISRHATQQEVDNGAALSPNVVVTPDTLAGTTLFARKRTATIGDGSATSFTFNHNLDTRDVLVGCVTTSGDYEDIEADFRRATPNSVTIVFLTPPAANSFRVTVIG
jgi:hypothetical protein